jgi:hypothetical protein
MAATDYYVDPGATVDTGSGTLGSPWAPRSSGKAAVQHALDTITRDTTNGDRINIKSGTNDVLNASLDFTNYGTPTSVAPIILQGYTSSQADRGVGVIDGNATYSVYDSTTFDFLHLIDLEITNSGSNVLFRTDDYNYWENVKFSSCTNAIGAYFGNLNAAINCFFEDLTGDFGFNIGAQNFAGWCYSDNIGLTDLGSLWGYGLFNILYLGSDTTFGQIYLGSDDQVACIHNTVYNSASVAAGISASRDAWMHLFHGNVVEGFSGAGGEGIDVSSMTTNDGSHLEYNVVNNCTTAYVDADHWVVERDNETGSASSMFNKTGVLTRADRFKYFEPTNNGNMLTMPGNWSKGAAGRRPRGVSVASRRRLI